MLFFSDLFLVIVIMDSVLKVKTEWLSHAGVLDYTHLFSQEYILQEFRGYNLRNFKNILRKKTRG